MQCVHVCSMCVSKYSMCVHLQVVHVVVLKRQKAADEAHCMCVFVSVITCMALYTTVSASAKSRGINLSARPS